MSYVRSSRRNPRLASLIAAVVVAGGMFAVSTQMGNAAESNPGKGKGANVSTEDKNGKGANASADDKKGKGANASADDKGGNKGKGCKGLENAQQKIKASIAKQADKGAGNANSAAKRQAALDRFNTRVEERGCAAAAGDAGGGNAAGDVTAPGAAGAAGDAGAKN
jgi:hypothetical protein